MRRIVAFNNVSADGYFSRPDGDLTWTVPDDALEREAQSGMQSEGRGTVLFGRRTFDMFESFWPNVVDASNTAPDPHAPGRRSEGMRVIGTYLNEADKVVVSKSRTSSSWKNTRFIPELTREAVDALRQEPGKDIMLFGSGTIASRLTELGLIDEYYFIVAPVFLGAGRSLLTGLPKSNAVELLEARSFPTGNLKLRYRLKR